jgi:hypothetical protein
MPKEVFIHAGLVFSDLLNVPRLRHSASELVRIYPELNVFAKRKLLSVRLNFPSPKRSSAPANFLPRAWNMVHATRNKSFVGLPTSQFA